MFEIQVNGAGKSQLPVTTTDTKTIYSYLRSVFCFDDQSSILSFRSIFLCRQYTYNLLEIGYSPKDLLKAQISNKRKAIFLIPDINFQVCLETDEYTNVFTIKEYFSDQFFTVPQNIVIKNSKNEVLYDFDTFDINGPFEVAVGEDYILVHTYTNQFNLVCVHKDSTIGNLKDTISIYTIKNNSIDTQFTYSEKMLEYCRKNKLDENTIDDTSIQKVMSTIPLFEFTPISNSNPSFYQINIQINDNLQKDKFIQRSYSASISTSLYSIACLLERHLRIDRRLFWVLGHNGEILATTEKVIIAPNQYNMLFFVIEKQLNVKFGNNICPLSYLTSIRDLQYMYQFAKHNFGIIVNNHFVFHNEENNKFLLVHFMNNWEDKNAMASIWTIPSLEECSLKSYMKLNESNKKENKKHFIIPNKMSNEEIAMIYLHQNYSSLQFFNENQNEVVYKDSNERKVFYVILDYSNQVSTGIARIQKKNPRVIDLLIKIYDDYDQQQPHFGVDEVAEALFNGRKLPFYEPLSNIFDDENQPILIQGYKQQRAICVYFLEEQYDRCNLNKYFFDYNAEKNYNKKYHAYEIINTLRCNYRIQCPNLKLYIDFNELRPYDIPSLYFQEANFFILTTSSEKKRFFISNEASLICPLDITRDNYEMMADVVAGMFSLKVEDIKVSCAIDNVEYTLPLKFDAGSLPNHSKLLIRYTYKFNNNKMTFRYGQTKKTIILPDLKQPIKSFIPLIQKELNILNISRQSFHLSFYMYQLSASKSFASYMIPGNSVITICLNQTAFSLKILTIERPKKPIDYIFNAGDTIKDAKMLFKLQFKLNVNFGLEPDQALEDNVELSPDMKLFVISKKKKISAFNGQGFEITDILTVFETAEYLKYKLYHRNVFIFIKNEEENCYEAVDGNKRLFEFNCQLFAHRFVPKIEFKNYIIFHSNVYLSECNTIEWLKKKFISQISFTNPSKILIYVNDKDLIDGNETIEKLARLKKDQLRIKFKSDKESKEKNRQKVSLKKFKPKISPLSGSGTIKVEPLEPPKKPENAKNDQDADNDKNDQDAGNDKNDQDDGNIDAVNDVIIEEEEEDVEDPSLCTYNFQINKNPVCKMSFKEDATIDDAKIRIAKENGDIDPSCVSILFAGKVLRKQIVIKDLNLINTDILQVFIRNTEDLFLRTAKALRIYNQADIKEYYSEYDE